MEFKDAPCFQLRCWAGSTTPCCRTPVRPDRLPFDFRQRALNPLNTPNIGIGILIVPRTLVAYQVSDCAVPWHRARGERAEHGDTGGCYATDAAPSLEFAFRDGGVSVGADAAWLVGRLTLTLRLADFAPSRSAIRVNWFWHCSSCTTSRYAGPCRFCQLYRGYRQAHMSRDYARQLLNDLGVQAQPEDDTTAR